MERIRLFEAGVSGFTTHRIPALFTTAAGTELAFCESRTASSDWAPMALQVRRRGKGGAWEDPVDIAASANGPAHNPAPFLPRTGQDAVRLLYGLDYRRVLCVDSSDGGRTWGAPRDITSAFDGFDVPFAVMATGPGGVVVMPSGRVVVPVWLGEGTEKNGHGPSRTACIYSDDGGESFRAGGVIPKGLDNPSEAQIALRADGTLLMSIRNRGPHMERAHSVSLDEGLSWSAPVYARGVIDPVCQGSILALPDGRLVYTGPQNDADQEGRSYCDRIRVSLLVGDAAGERFRVSRVLEPAASGYTALCMGGDGSLLCLCEVWPTGSYGTMSLDLFRIPVGEI